MRQRSYVDAFTSRPEAPSLHSYCLPAAQDNLPESVVVRAPSYGPPLQRTVIAISAGFCVTAQRKLAASGNCPFFLCAPAALRIQDIMGVLLSFVVNLPTKESEDRGPSGRPFHAGRHP